MAFAFSIIVAIVFIGIPLGLIIGVAIANNSYQKGYARGRADYQAITNIPPPEDYERFGE